jgi:hypothetical protein
MFRTFFRSLIMSRPQAKARPQVQSFRPQLETLEGRLAPSGLTGINISHNHDVGVIVAQSATIAFSGGHNSINQVAIVGFGIG